MLTPKMLLAQRIFTGLKMTKNTKAKASLGGHVTLPVL